LAEVLNLDTAVRLQTPAQATGLLELVDLRRDLEGLVAQAQASRPEVAALAAETARRQAQVVQERARPFLPTLSVGYSAGTFGGGAEPRGPVAGPPQLRPLRQSGRFRRDRLLDGAERGPGEPGPPERAPRPARDRRGRTDPHSQPGTPGGGDRLRAGGGGASAG